MIRAGVALVSPGLGARLIVYAARTGRWRAGACIAEGAVPLIFPGAVSLQRNLAVVRAGAARAADTIRRTVVAVFAERVAEAVSTGGAIIGARAVVFTQRVTEPIATSQAVLGTENAILVRAARRITANRALVAFVAGVDAAIAGDHANIVAVASPVAARIPAFARITQERVGIRAILRTIAVILPGIGVASRITTASAFIANIKATVAVQKTSRVTPAPAAALPTAFAGSARIRNIAIIGATARILVVRAGPVSAAGRTGAAFIRNETTGALTLHHILTAARVTARAGLRTGIGIATRIRDKRGSSLSCETLRFIGGSGDAFAGGHAAGVGSAGLCGCPARREQAKDGEDARAART